jgi:glutamine synthetase
MRFTPFIERHGLWSDDARRQAAELERRIAAEGVRLVRVAWVDPHGASRAKMLTLPAFRAALADGYNINVATTTLDSANARTFASFTRGGGMGIEAMTGSPNITIVPDPSTFRVLPWAPGVGWIVCDEYFNDGTPFPFSPRQILRRALAALASDGFGHMVGLEVEWYLTRLADPHLADDNVSLPGVRGRPPAVRPIEPGYSYHSETNLDLMQPVLSQLADAYAALGLPLRSLENEWGPGQVECTFAHQDALEAADDLVLFRTATKQIVRRLGYHASFMCRPAIRGFYSSGWHLHQSLVDRADGRNRFTPATAGERLSPVGMGFLGGLLEHAVEATVFASPTANGYRRFRANSLAPDRAGWGIDHRGAMLRVLGGPGDPAARIENRVGEPAANPYLYFASQIVAGRDGLARRLDPGAADDEPYAAARRLLPGSLEAALDALDRSRLFRGAFGDVFVDYYLAVKRNEAGRFAAWRAERGMQDLGPEPTEWEQNEYFDFF